MYFLSPSVPFIAYMTRYTFVVRNNIWSLSQFLWSSNLFEVNLSYTFVMFQHYCLLISRNLKLLGSLLRFLCLYSNKKWMQFFFVCTRHYWLMKIMIIVLGWEQIFDSEDSWVSKLWKAQRVCRVRPTYLLGFICVVLNNKNWWLKWL